MEKKGLSSVVTTLLIILVALIAIGIVWAAVSIFINKGTSAINLDQLTIKLGIKSAKINYSTGIATVRVVRNAGQGDLSKIKFIVEDKHNSEVFDEDASDFPELAERTYYLDLNTKPRLILNEVYKISIAPIYINSQTGIETLGGITDSIGGLDANANISQQKPDLTNGTVCKQNSDCGIDYWINNSETCNSDNTEVLQFKRLFSCVLGFCVASSEQQVKEDCPTGTYCYNAACITQKIPCNLESVETDCGISDWIGVPSCSTDKKSIIQDWQEYLCINNFCEINTTKQTKEVCENGELCFNGDCFVPLECTQNSDCDFGEVCKDGKCVTEVVINSGVIRSIWPFGVGEYFDSQDLPVEETARYAGYHVIFPGSTEERCLTIRDFVTPDFEGGITYVRVNESKTNIRDGDNYQIWETNYICSTI